jgi:hypothetical protein
MDTHRFARMRTNSDAREHAAAAPTIDNKVRTHLTRQLYRRVNLIAVPVHIFPLISSNLRMRSRTTDDILGHTKPQDHGPSALLLLSMKVISRSTTAFTSTEYPGLGIHADPWGTRRPQFRRSKYTIKTFRKGNSVAGYKTYHTQTSIDNPSISPS